MFSVGTVCIRKVTFNSGHQCENVTVKQHVMYCWDTHACTRMVTLLLQYGDCLREGFVRSQGHKLIVFTD